jgi:hypothetical protein
VISDSIPKVEVCPTIILSRILSKAAVGVKSRLRFSTRTGVGQFSIGFRALPLAARVL